MTPEWAQVTASVITVAGVCFTAWMAHGARTNAGTASRHAEQAAEYGRPTGNGFATEVRTNLSMILATATEARDDARAARALAEDNQEAHARHLEAHANGYAAPVSVTTEVVHHD